MEKLVNAVVRTSIKHAALPTIAMAAMLTGMTAAHAFDQQATSAQMDNAINHAAAARGFSHHAYAYSHRHRSAR